MRRRYGKKFNIKRLVILCLCFVFLFLIVLIAYSSTGCKSELIQNHLGCGCKSDVMALICANQIGVKCEGENAEGEWYPLLFGFEMFSPGCMSPVICGFDICAGSLTSSEGYKTYLPSSSEGTDVVVIENVVQEYVDYKIDSMYYMLIDRKGEQQVANNFESLFYEDGMWGRIKDDSMKLDSINNYTFGIGVTIGVEVLNDCNLEIEFAVKESSSLSSHYISAKTSGYYEKGFHYIEVIIEDIDYINSRYKMSISKLEFNGTKKYFVKG